MKTLVIDIDGTILEERTTFERPLADVYRGARECLTQFMKDGYTVILYTARGWTEYNQTVAQLATFDIPYSQLIMGKPIADYWIDDRAIRFTNWASIYKLVYGKEKRTEEIPLKMMRKHIYDFLANWHHLTSHNSSYGNVLDIGPMDKETMPFPQYYFDTKTMFRATTIGNSGNVDILKDVTDGINGRYDTIIMCSVLEHITKPWLMPKILSDALYEGGTLLLQTPFHFRFHGPNPDLWRFTDDGLIELFEDYFELEDMDKLDYRKNPLEPVSITTVWTKLSQPKFEPTPNPITEYERGIYSVQQLQDWWERRVN